MTSTANLKLLINKQKVLARKSIAMCNYRMYKMGSRDRHKAIITISNERKFLEYNFNNIKTVEDLIEIVHSMRHKGETIKSSICNDCKKILAEDHTLDSQDEEKLKPRFGNLLAILENESREELENLQRKRLPSQNDLTRWALKDAVFAFYQNMNIPSDIVVVDTLYDDRLTSKLAPDFDVIANIWMEKLDELQRRNDKFTLDPEEYDRAESDLADGMRGSAFEKQLDRYREEFMSKLMR